VSGPPAGGALRIAHVVTTGRFAGTERYVVDVGGELAARGHRVTVVGGDPGAVPALLPAGVRWRPGASAAEAVRSLAGAGRQDLVHSHTSKSDFAALGAALATGGARVSTRHITARRGHDGLARRLAPLVRRALAREVVVSRWVAGRVETVPDVVLVNGVVPAADREAPPPGAVPVVLVAQRLAPEKRTALALRAFAASGLAAHGWQLHVAGDGVERPALEALAGELGVGPGTRFLGWLADPAPAYRGARLLLATAPEEPCGLVVLEAMAHGLPVVAAGAAGHLETVGRHPAAALFPPGDVEAAAGQLRRLAGDDAAREGYGRALQALQRAELTLAGHVDALEAVYRGALR
jgi:glycosyltransferase involved in cell wall biosynthesis